MTERDWTPEPWVAGLDLPGVKNNNTDPRLVWAGSMLIGDFRSQWVSEEKAAANAARAVACVNALAGVDAPAALRRLLLDNRHSIHEAVRCDNEDLADELWRFLSKLS